MVAIRFGNKKSADWSARLREDDFDQNSTIGDFVKGAGKKERERIDRADMGRSGLRPYGGLWWRIDCARWIEGGTLRQAQRFQQASPLQRFERGGGTVHMTRIL